MFHYTFRVCAHSMTQHLFGLCQTREFNFRNINALHGVECKTSNSTMKPEKFGGLSLASSNQLLIWPGDCPGPSVGLFLALMSLLQDAVPSYLPYKAGHQIN